jgi:hypothetical protein
MRNALRSLGVIVVFVLTTAVTPIVDPPDVCLNSSTGLIEAVDSTWSGTNYNVRSIQVSPKGEQLNSTLLTSNPANDMDPRVLVLPAGDVIVAFWRDLTNDALIYRKRGAATGAWGPERIAGASYESNSRPRLAYCNGKSWIAYQIQSSKSRSLCGQIIDDDPEPFRTVVATTGFTGLFELQLKCEAGQLWMTWIDSGQRVGYAEYLFDKQVWTVPAFESFAADSAQAARLRIREKVLAP